MGEDGTRQTAKARTGDEGDDLSKRRSYVLGTVSYGYSYELGVVT